MYPCRDAVPRVSEMKRSRLSKLQGRTSLNLILFFVIINLIHSGETIRTRL